MKVFNLVSELENEILENKSTIYLFTGNIGTGKNYLAFELGKSLQDYGFNIFYTAFAKELKRIVLYITGYLKRGKRFHDNFKTPDEIVNFLIKTYKINKLSSKENILKAVNEYYNKISTASVRDILQITGDLLRSFDKDFFANHTAKTIKNVYNSTDFVFITDLRYPNELKVIRNNFKNVKVIRVVAPLKKILERQNISYGEYLKFLKHSSEQQIDLIDKIDYIFINNN